LTLRQGHLVRKAPGSDHFDYRQTIRFNAHHGLERIGTPQVKSGVWCVAPHTLHAALRSTGLAQAWPMSKSLRSTHAPFQRTLNSRSFSTLMLPQIRHAAASQRLHLEDAPVVFVWRQALRGVERRGTRRPVRHEGDYFGMCRRYAPLA